MMSSSQVFEELWTQFKASLPPGAEQFKQDLEAHAKLALKKQFKNMDLVTREEFEVQKKVLQKAIERIKALEKELAT